MKFFLDHCLPRSKIRRVLRQAGEMEVIVAENVGMARSKDSEIAVYAHSQDAIVLSGDGGFYDWRRTHAFGFHVYLKIPKPEMADRLTKVLPEVLRLRKKNGEGICIVDRDTVRFERGRVAARRESLPRDRRRRGP